MDRRKGRKKRLARLVILIVGIILLWHFLDHKPNSKENLSLNVFQTKPTSSPLSCPIANFGISNDALADSVGSALNGTHGAYGIVISNLKTGEAYLLNQNTVFDSASLYKLWIMAVVYEQIQEGKIKENQVLSDNYENLNKLFRINPKLAEKTEGTITTSVKNALVQMITVSDNYSALILSKQVGLSSVQNFLDKNCLTDSKVGINGDSPTTSANDIALFFQELYKGKLGDQDTTKAMINLLEQQKFTDKIPKYLPYTIQLSVAHKTGELDPYSHDAGIVYTSNGNYIIVIMSKSDSRDLANERIANVSKAVYQYFNPSGNLFEASSSAN